MHAGTQAHTHKYTHTHTHTHAHKHAHTHTHTHTHTQHIQTFFSSLSPVAGFVHVEREIPPGLIIMRRSMRFLSGRSQSRKLMS